MADARWLDVDTVVASSVRHFSGALELAKEGEFRLPDRDGYRAAMAFLHAMQSGHGSAEAALLRILAILNEKAPSGEDWQQVLIERCSRPVPGNRPAILPKAVAEDLHETRRFRHRAMHVYDDFNPDRVGPSLEAVSLLVTTLPEAIKAFKTRISP